VLDDTKISRRLPSKSTNQGRHAHAVRGPDFYPTPAALTRALLAHCALPQHIWEPAAGRGDIANVLTGAGHTVAQTDLIDYGAGNLSAVQDFLSFDGPLAPCIVTNPPFKIAGDFIRHGLSLCDTVITLNRLMFLEGRARSDILDTHLAEALVFIERPPMMHRWSQGPDGVWREWQGKKATSAMPFAWFIFRRRHNAKKQGTAMKRISWKPHSRDPAQSLHGAMRPSAESD